MTNAAAITGSKVYARSPSVLSARWRSSPPGAPSANVSSVITGASRVEQVVANWQLDVISKIHPR